MFFVWIDREFNCVNLSDIFGFVVLLLFVIREEYGFKIGWGI